MDSHLQNVNKVILSSSMIQTFQGCRKQFEYVYKRGISPTQSSDSLMFGSFMHRALELWFNTIRRQQNDQRGISWIERQFEFTRNLHYLFDEEVILTTEDKIKASALLQEYRERYCDDLADYEIEAVEMEFVEPLKSPDGKKESKTFCLGGKVDAVVRSTGTGRLYILEHKTARSCNDGYIDRVSIDFQTALYAMAIEEAMGQKVAGVIYDVIVKSSLEMKQGETDEEFEARKAEAKQPSRCKRRESETEEEFYNRVSASLTEKNFVRVTVDFDDERRQELAEEIWAVARDIENCRCFYKCTGNCLKFGVCPFMSLCKAHGDVNRLSYEEKDSFKVAGSIHPELSAQLTSQFKEVF